MDSMVSGVAGMRWVSYVKVAERDGTSTYTAVGIGHRRPAEVPIGPATARRLFGKVPFVRVKMEG
jgi:hypothetical protein